MSPGTDRIASTFLTVFGLDLDDHHGVVVGVAGVLLGATVDAGRTPRSPASGSVRGVAHRGNGSARVVGGVDHGHDHAVGAGVEDLADHDRVVGGRSDEHRQLGRLQRDQRALQRLEGDGDVLHVDEQEVEIDITQCLGDGLVLDHVTDPDDRATLLQGCQHAVPHGRSSLFLDGRRVDLTPEVAGDGHTVAGRLEAGFLVR
ncbi:MAG: hypothetical protein L0K86_24955, partial [Actinomycetia bacterium]|nr:hypothetical protein [Actinomycetes bacterium]